MPTENIPMQKQFWECCIDQKCSNRDLSGIHPASNLHEAVAGLLAQKVVEGCAVEPDVLTLGVGEADVGALSVDAQVLLQDGVQHG